MVLGSWGWGPAAHLCLLDFLVLEEGLAEVKPSLLSYRCGTEAGSSARRKM